MTEQIQYSPHFFKAGPIITKWHNSCNTDPSASIFLLNMHCLMVKVWCGVKSDKSYLCYRAKTLIVDGTTEFWTC